MTGLELIQRIRSGYAPGRGARARHARRGAVRAARVQGQCQRLPDQDGAGDELRAPCARSWPGRLRDGEPGRARGAAAQRRRGRCRHAHLSDRELEGAAPPRCRAAPTDIADALHLSIKTISTHKARIQEKAPAAHHRRADPLRPRSTACSTRTAARFRCVPRPDPAPPPRPARRDLVVLDLVEVAVMQADGANGRAGPGRRGRRPRRAAGRRSRAARLAPRAPVRRAAAAQACSAARTDRAGGDAVVDDDHRRAGQRQRLAAAQVERAAALDLGKLALRRGVDLGALDAREAAHLLVDHDLGLSAVDDRGDGEFGLPRNADLAHEQQVERRPRRRATIAAIGTPPRAARARRSVARAPAQPAARRGARPASARSARAARARRASCRRQWPGEPSRWVANQAPARCAAASSVPAPRTGGSLRERPPGACCSAWPASRGGSAAAPRIGPADDEQRRRIDRGQARAGEVRPTAATPPRRRARPLRRRAQRRARRCSRRTVRCASPPCRRALPASPRRRRPRAQQFDVEHVCRSAASASSSRSKSRVASPWSCSTPATNRLRGLRRSPPLPWAKTTIACAAVGSVSSPSSPASPTCTAADSSPDRPPAPREGASFPS